MRDSRRDTDIKNRLLDSVGEGKGGIETVYLRFGLESMWLGLKPSQNPVYLVSGLNEAQVLDVSLQEEFRERQSDR